MKLIFNKIEIHNFLSFENETIDLANCGYTLVNGVNNNPIDNAKSNGSGKSSIWEAISWCLTGETIRGTKDIRNRYLDDGAYVEIWFNNGNDDYHVLRSKEHSKYKTNLKIYINDEDRSGKGIRDSEKLLKEYLPDLTSNLIGSVILLGQGLPHRFSNNSPSGRKEVLEELSKSDFMIEDLKNRISTRKNELSTGIRTLEDTSLTIKNKIDFEISKQDQSLKSLRAMTDSLLETIKEDVNKYTELISTCNKDIENALINKSNIEKEKLEVKEKEIQLNSELKVAHSEIDEQFSSKNIELNSTLASLMTELNQNKKSLKSMLEIKDVCPYCGQKIPDVHKPDTKEIEDAISKSEKEIESTKESIKVMNEEKQEALKERTLKIEQDKKEIHLKLSEVESNLLDCENGIKTLNKDLGSYKDSLNDATYAMMNFNSRKEELSKAIELSITNIEELNSKLLYNDNELQTQREHLDVINKMSTIVSRDFRGYLLTNVIEYINMKSKEYSKKVFGNEHLNFVLDGNNISISFDDKEYENLSGGEKQKIDLIVQFAIRDMLCKYLNFSSNILVLDELFDNLDSQGCENVLNLISEVNDVDSIFIVTHHSDLQIPSDNIITIEKGIDKISRVKK